MNQFESVSLDKYKSDTLRDPKGEATKIKYLKYYEEYAQGNLTQQQLADKYNIEINSVNRAIKWAVHYLHDAETAPDVNVERSALVDRLKIRSQKIEKELEKKRMKIRDRCYIFRELRLHDKLKAEVQGILSSALIDMSDKRQVNVITNLERRTGEDEGKNK